MNKAWSEKNKKMQALIVEAMGRIKDRLER